MSKRWLFRAVCYFVLLAPLAVTSTPPSIPWDIYEIDGQVVRTAGSLANYTVALGEWGWFDDAETKQWRRLTHCELPEAETYGPYSDLALTGADGKFWLRLVNCSGIYADSLAIAVVYPDTIIVSTRFKWISGSSSDITATGHIEDDGFFCDDDEEYEYTRAHIYSYPSVTVPVP